MSTTKLPALDALFRGILNVRANRELILVQLASSALLAASIAVPILLLLSRVGVPLSVFTSKDPEAIRVAFESMQFNMTMIASTFGLGLLLFLVIGTVAFVAFCWFQAGTLAVLLSGDAQAPAADKARSEVFRTFSWSAYVGWASRYGWRIFWVNNLFMILLTIGLGLFVLPFAIGARFAEGSGTMVACAIGCGMAIPLGFIALVVVLAMIVAQVSAVDENATVRGATRRAFTITGRRLGGLLLLYLLLIVASIIVSVLFGGAGLVVNLVLAKWAMARLAVAAALWFVQFVLSTSLNLTLIAAIVALVRPELRALPAAATQPAA
ncbi:MAG: hypothetical protein ABI639_16135 [Thermoanaerobaculia bacterium]